MEIEFRTKITTSVTVEVKKSRHPRLGVVYCTFVNQQIASVISSEGSHDVDPYPDNELFCVERCVASYSNIDFIPRIP